MAGSTEPGCPSRPRSSSHPLRGVPTAPRNACRRAVTVAAAAHRDGVSGGSGGLERRPGVSGDAARRQRVGLAP